MVKEQGKKRIWAQSIVYKPKLNDDDFDNMKNLNKSAAADFNDAGRTLKIQIWQLDIILQNIKKANKHAR